MIRALLDRLTGSAKPTEDIPPAYPLSPGDVICVGGGRWEVRAVLLGALGQESVLEVRRLGYAPPSDVDGFPTFTHVPVRFVDALLADGSARVLAARRGRA